MQVVTIKFFFCTFPFSTRAFLRRRQQCYKDTDTRGRIYLSLMQMGQMFKGKISMALMRWRL